MSIKHLLIVGFAATALASCGGKGNDAGKTASGAPVVATAGPAGNDFMSVYTRDLNKIADAIEKTHDEASAHEAALVIQSVNGELDGLNKQFEGKTDAEKTALIMAHNGEWIQAQQRVAMSMTKLTTADPKILQMIGTEMDKMPKPDTPK